MTYIDFIATLVESLIFTIIIFAYFNIKSISKFITLPIIWLLSNFFFNYFTLSNNVFMFFLLLTYVLFLSFEFKHFDFSFISFPLILLGGLLIANSLSVSLISFSNNITVKDISSNVKYMIDGIIVSRILFIIISVIFYTILKNKKDTTTLKEWWLLIVFMFVLFLMLNSILSSIIFDRISINLIYVLLGELIFLTISSFFIYQKVQQQNKLNIHLAKELITKEYHEKLYDIITKTSDQIKRDKHTILYSLLKIDQLVQSNDQKELRLFVKNEINKQLNYRYVSFTNNPLFDYEYTKKINDLLHNGIDIKSIILINDYCESLYDENFIEYLLKVIDTVCTSKNVEIMFKEINKYLVLKIKVFHSNDQAYNFKKHSFINKIDIKSNENFIEYSFLIKKAPKESN